MNSTTPITTKQQAYPITLLSFSSPKPFDDVVTAFEEQLGWLNEEQALSSHNLPRAIQSMEGPTGLMIIRVIGMDNLLPALSASSTRARQYLVGNPLIASKMAAFDPLAALYAPPRVLIYTHDGTTWISYDKPTSVFGRLEHDEIFRTATELDEKFELIARQALAMVPQIQEVSNRNECPYDSTTRNCSN